MCNQTSAIQILGEAYTGYNAVLNNRVCDAYLYGSYARGDYHEESDVDVLLLVDMDESAISDVWMQLAQVNSDLSLKHDVTVSVAVKPVSQFKRYCHILPYYQNVLKEGIRFAV